MNTWINYFLTCRYKYLLGALFIFTLTITHVQAAPCDPVLAPFPGSDLGYTVHGDRCEGFYVSNVSSESLEVVSVLHGNLYFDWRPDVVIEVSAPNYTQGEVNIRAVSIPMKTYYRMDGTVSPKESMRWPIGDVVYPGKLSAQRLGVFGWVGTENNKTFVPLRVTQKNIAKSAPAKENTYLMVRSSVDVDTVLWRYSTAVGKRCSKFNEWQEHHEAPVNAGWPVKITLPNGTAQKGNLCLDIAAKERDNDEWLSLSIRIWRPSSP
jgi:hypothetical protein